MMMGMRTDENEGFDYSRLSVAERLLLAQELLDSVYDAVTPPPAFAAADAADRSRSAA